MPTHKIGKNIKKLIELGKKKITKLYKKQAENLIQDRLNPIRSQTKAVGKQVKPIDETRREKWNRENPWAGPLGIHKRIKTPTKPPEDVGARHDAFFAGKPYVSLWQQQQNKEAAKLIPEWELETRKQIAKHTSGKTNAGTHKTNFLGLPTKIKQEKQEQVIDTKNTENYDKYIGRKRSQIVRRKGIQIYQKIKETRQKTTKQ